MAAEEFAGPTWLLEVAQEGLLPASTARPEPACARADPAGMTMATAAAAVRYIQRRTSGSFVQCRRCHRMAHEAYSQKLSSGRFRRVASFPSGRIESAKHGRQRAGCPVGF